MMDSSPSHLLVFPLSFQGWVHSSADGCFVGGCDPMASSHFVYRLTTAKTTQAFVTVIQPKKRSNTKSQYWYCDPSMLLLQQLVSGEWQRVACALSGVRRQNHVDVFLEGGCNYYCIPFSCLASQQRQRGSATFPFRLTTYSSESVMIEPISVNADLSLAARTGAVSLLHKELLARDLKFVYPVATAGILACVPGQGSLYFIAVNGATDHYLSLRITVDNLSDNCGLMPVFGRLPEGSYDVPPASQRLLLVVATNGSDKTTTTATNFTFRYMSSFVSVKRAMACDDLPLPSRRPPAPPPPVFKSNAPQLFGSSIELSLTGGHLLTTASCNIDSIQIAGGGTIDTHLWIPPQLGAI